MKITSNSSKGCKEVSEIYRLEAFFHTEQINRNENKFDILEKIDTFFAKKNHDSTAFKSATSGNSTYTDPNG